MEDALRKEELLWISQLGAALYAMILPVLTMLALWGGKGTARCTTAL